MEGWNNSTLKNINGIWFIFSDTRIAFVPLLSACDKLLECCKGAKIKLEEILNEPF